MIKKIIASMLAVAMVTAMSTTVFADEGVDKMSDSEKFQTLNDSAYEIEQYIENQGTSVLEILCYEKTRLETTLLPLETAPDRIMRLENLINEYSRRIIAYREYLAVENANGNGISAFGAWHPLYSPAVTAVVAYFTSSRFNLAAELLMHAENTTNTYTFNPYWGDIVAKQTAELTNRLNAMTPGDSGSGSSSFSGTSTLAEKDMYYAIHMYNYTYDFTNGNRNFIINDTYDFALGMYEGLAGAAVNTMWQAQQFGVITAFPVQIAILNW